MSSNDNQDDTLAATAEASLLPPPQQHCTESPPVAAMLDPIHATQDSATKRSPQRVSWDDRLTMLRAFREQHGHLLIPIRYKQNPSLGKFVHNMREQYKLFHHQVGYKKKCSLTPERIEQLNELGFVWSTERRKRQREDWDKRYEQLKEYKAKHGDCLVPHGYAEDPSFAEWVHRHRTTFAKYQETNERNALWEERITLLKEIGFVFTVHSDKWMEHWHQLKAYKEKHGNTQVPTHYSENPQLGRWVHTQRHQYRLQEKKKKKSSMTPERVALLNELEFVWEVHSEPWQQRYQELQEFRRQHPNALPWTGDLRAWCVEQVYRLKQGDKRLGPERVMLLQQVGLTIDTVFPTFDDRTDDSIQ